MAMTARLRRVAHLTTRYMGLKRRDLALLGILAAAGVFLAVVLVATVTLAISSGNTAWWSTTVLAASGVAVSFLLFLRVLLSRYRTKRPSGTMAESRLDLAICDARASVTVVIPAFCESARLGSALDSLIAQTHPFWRAIIVDDQSSDTTSAVGVSFARRDPRITVLRLRRNSGLPAARNAGLTQVDTEFVLFLDGDDAMFPEALERRVALLTSDVAAAGAYGKIRQVPLDANWHDEAAKPGRGATARRITLVSSAGENPFGIHEVLLRTQRVLDLGGFDESLRRGGEDVHFWARALRSGYEFAGTGIVDCIYVQTPTSMVSAGATAHLEVVVTFLDRAWRGEACHAEVSHGPGLDSDLGEVLRRGMVEDRLLRYFGMAIQAGDAAARDHVIVQLEAAAPLTLSREAALAPVMNGVRRSLKRVGVQHDAGVPQRAREALATIERLFSASDATPLPRRDHPAWAVLVENRAQAVAVVQALRERPHDQWPTFLVSDSVDADQGGLEYLETDVPDSVRRSIPSYLIDGVAYDLVVLPRPISWVGRLVAEVATERGSELRELDFLWSDLVAVVDEETRAAGVNELATPAPRIEISGLTALTRPRGNIARHRVQPNRRSMPGLSTKDGAQGDYRGLDLPTTQRLMELKDRYRGQRCVIIGNGPSLNKTDLEQLRGMPTFGVNGIYYADTRLPEPLTFYVVEDTKVFEENRADVLGYGREKAGAFILPTFYRPSLGEDDDPVMFRMNGGFYRADDPSFARPRFSTNAAEVLFCGQSVTIINLQLAYWMGFSEVGLIGMDFSYAIPEGTTIKGHHYTSAGDDPNHFDSRYFGAGKTWKDPRLDRVLANYELAKAIYASDGRRIVNCTVGGALEAFERQDLAAFARG